jgi:crotonobetainyl-CoA:carnitine CoA-transferase CaiB-like acyl-CoA transferase
MYRQQTGKGQWIDLSQLEAPIHALIGEHVLEYTVNGTQTLPLGNRHRQYAPHGCYRCKGEDKWVALAVRSDKEWERLCEVIGHTELTWDTRFATSVDRLHNHDELDRVIEEWTILRAHDEAMHLLQQAGIAAGAVLNVAELSTDPHLQERAFFQHAKEDTERLFPGMPFRLSDGSGELRRPGPRLGEHNEYVLCELLGYAKEGIEPPTEEKIGTALDTE